MRESTVAGATGGEVPEQNQDVSQPPRRKATRVTIWEPSSTPRAAIAPAQQGKGKQKLSKHPEPILESSDENDKPTDKVFNLYTNPTTTTPASKKKSNRRQPREGCSDPSVKRARTKDPPAPTPSKETTPPPGPADQNPPAPTDQNPLVVANPSPAAQLDKTLVEAILNSACTSASDRLKKLSRHRIILESFSNSPTMPVDQLLNRGLNELLTGILTVSTSWRRSEEAVAKHAEEIKAVEGRLAEQHKMVEAKHVEELQTAVAKISKLEEELKKKEDSELEISRKEVADLEETNARNLEKYEGATFQCFYMFWKSNPKADFTYLPDPIREAELVKCVARLEEEERAQGSPEISLATGIEGVNEDVGATVNQQPQEPQDPSDAS
ncbi:uncharacterized protein LOC133785727 [Humulus lupulus]|uniref:uncharacterized protein LOC133785727 n=1 Tax=Humulus lupulus TaxID=3486 RepID=UPI002B401BD7|nr:uncharacterized protein LOC133785727 [Humulus lupulus]